MTLNEFKAATIGSDCFKIYRNNNFVCHERIFNTVDECIEWAKGRNDKVKYYTIRPGIHHTWDWDKNKPYCRIKREALTA